MEIPERCLKCEWWNFNRKRCDRVFKVKMMIGQDSGEVVIETQPGVIPKHMEEDLGTYLATILGDIVDSWPGWREIHRIRDGEKKVCAAEKPSVTIKEFGKKLKLAEPLKNLDANGLFKSDISLL